MFDFCYYTHKPAEEKAPSPPAFSHLTASLYSAEASLGGETAQALAPPPPSLSPTLLLFLSSSSPPSPSEALSAHSSSDARASSSDGGEGAKSVCFVCVLIEKLEEVRTGGGRKATLPLSLLLFSSLSFLSLFPYLDPLPGNSTPREASTEPIWAFSTPRRLLLRRRRRR